MITSYALHKAGSISLAAGAAIMLTTSCESAPSLIPFPPVHKQHHQKSLKLAQSSSHLCIMLIHCISKNIGETNPNRSKLGETSGAAQLVVQLELSLEKQEPVGKAVPRKSNKILNSDQITNNWRVVQCVLICLEITRLYICFKES